VFAATLACAAAGSALAASSAFGVAQTIVAIDDSYVGATFTMDQGDRPTFQNTGTGSHDVTAKTNGPDGKFLFASPKINTGTTVVEGTQYLTAGSYAFFCTVHPLTMTANLQVSAAGTPVARPKIDVLLSKGKLEKIAKKGKVQATVKALSQSDGIALELALGKSVIATQKAFNLAAGQQRKITLKVNKAGKSKLAGAGSAKLKLTGEVPFGAPDSAKKTYK
jgi:plastocyanin